MAARDLPNHDGDERRIVAPGSQQDLRDALELLAGRLVRDLHGAKASDELAPVLDEDRPQDIVLRREVVVEEPVRDARVLCDVTDARFVVPVLREHANGSVEDARALVLRCD